MHGHCRSAISTVCQIRVSTAASRSSSHGPKCDRIGTRCNRVKRFSSEDARARRARAAERAVCSHLSPRSRRTASAEDPSHPTRHDCTVPASKAPGERHGSCTNDHIARAKKLEPARNDITALHKTVALHSERGRAHISAPARPTRSVRRRPSSPDSMPTPSQPDGSRSGHKEHIGSVCPASVKGHQPQQVGS